MAVNNGNEMREMYMENLEGYVLDEDRIVTYKWLSRTLEIPVNDAKTLLEDFLKSHQSSKNKCKLYVTYLIAGTLKTGGSTLAVVKEEDRKTFLEKLEKVSCEHVYSVHKSQPKDLHALYGPDYEKWKESSAEAAATLSAIIYVKAKPRTANDVTALRMSKQPLADKIPVAKTLKKATFKNEGQVNGTEKKNVDDKSETSNENEITKNGSMPPEKLTKINKGGIAQMFANQNAKKTSEPKKETEQKSKKVEKRQGIASFFSKQDQKAPPTETKKLPQNEEMKRSEEVEKVKKPNTKTSEKKGKEKVSEEAGSKKPLVGKENKAVKVDEKKKTKVQTKSSRHKKEESDDEDPLPKKKRRRIVEMSDSDSSEDEGLDIDDDDESPCPAAVIPLIGENSDIETEEKLPAEPESPKDDKVEGSNGRKRRRRLVDKTFMDEDGYIVTKKEYVFESCSESEESDSDKSKSSSKKVQEEICVQKKGEDIEDKKKISPQKVKQTLLMSFFKKR